MDSNGMLCEVFKKKIRSNFRGVIWHSIDFPFLFSLFGSTKSSTTTNSKFPKVATERAYAFRGAHALHRNDSKLLILTSLCECVFVYVNSYSIR